MVIWPHLTGGVTFPPRTNSAVSMPPRGLLTAQSRGAALGREGAAGDSPQICRLCGTLCVILLQFQPSRNANHVYIRLEPTLKRIPLKNEMMKRKRDVVTPTQTHPRLIHQEDSSGY